jgi:hypothetical protein
LAENAQLASRDPERRRSDVGGSVSSARVEPMTITQRMRHANLTEN